MSTLPVIHVITDDTILQSPDFLDRADRIMTTLGSHGALHLRGHHTPAKVMYGFAVRLAPRVPTLVINDRIDIALAARIGAVQVGRRSLTVEEVRRVAPSILIGESLHEVKQSTADWVIAGHVFDTPSHAAEPSRGLAFLHQICQTSTVPVIAIGGIRPRDVRAVRDAGAHGVAVIRGIWDADTDAVHEYLGEFDR